MTTSIPTNTSSSRGKDACVCSRECGCCTRKALAAQAAGSAVPHEHEHDHHHHDDHDDHEHDHEAHELSDVPPLAHAGFFALRPWLFVVAVFGVCFTAWGVMFNLAFKNVPKTVPLEHLSK